VNLPYPEDGDFALSQHVQQHRLRRINRIVMPSGGAHKTAGSSGERPGNHAPDAMPAVEQLPRYLTHAVKFGDGDYLFMRGDLKDAVA
jgi:hypothetical protein